MPYTIPSSVISPGSVYQPRQIPAVISQNARALYYTRGGSTSGSLLLDQSPLNSGTRRTGEEGRCYTADGTDDEVNFGDIGSAIWFSGWVKLNSDNQCLFSLSNDTNTNLIVSAGVLTAGATLTLSAIKVDDVSKTASEAGVLLNDNAWHFLSCGIGDGLGGASTADDVRFFTDGTNHGSVSGFDWRFWSTAPTAAELTEAYSGSTTNRNIAALSKYALWAKCDEQSGTTAYGSSGNGLTGTLANITAATFHSTQDIWSFQNQVGFNTGRNYAKYSEEFDNPYWIKASSTISANQINGPFGEALAADKLIWDNLATSAGYIRVVLGESDTSQNPVVLFTLTGLGSAAVVSGTVYDYGIDLISDGWYRCYATVFNYTVSIYAKAAEFDRLQIQQYNGLVHFYVRDSTVTQGDGSSGIYIFGAQVDKSLVLRDYQKTVAIAPQSAFLPRDESDPTNDVIGNPLTNIGRRPNDAKLNGSNCLTADGTLYIAAAHLAGTEAVVSSGGTSTPSISAGRIDFTAGTCWDLTLSDGTHYPLSEGWGVDIGSSTSDDDGVLTNSILANAWGATQNEYHYNLVSGHSLYEHATTAAIRWPFKNGSVKTLTPPTGYSKTSDNYPGNYHNNAETLIDLDPDSTPEMGATQLGITVPASHAFGDAFAASNQIFSRQRTLTEDRFVVMPEAQTGSALATIQKYTQP